MLHFFSRLFGFRSRAAKAQAEALAAENAVPAVCTCEPEDVHCDAMLDALNFDEEWEDDELGLDDEEDDDFLEDDWGDWDSQRVSYAESGYDGCEDAYEPQYAYGGGDCGGFDEAA